MDTVKIPRERYDWLVTVLERVATLKRYVDTVKPGLTYIDVEMLDAILGLGLEREEG